MLALLVDPCRVKLRSGTEATVGQYVKALAERQLRQKRGSGIVSAPLAVPGGLASLEPPSSSNPPSSHSGGSHPPSSAVSSAGAPEAAPALAEPPHAVLPARVMLGLAR